MTVGDYIANPFVVVLGADETWAPPAKCRVLSVYGVMVGAGATSDTVKLTDGTNDICPAVDVSAKADTDIFQVAKLDDAHRDLVPGTDTLTSVVVSAAAAELIVTLAWIA